MSYSPKEQKAIQHHMDSHGCIVQLSVRPNMRFITKGESDEHIKSLNSLVSEYETWKKDDQAERARITREKKRNEKLRGPYKEQYQ